MVARRLVPAVALLVLVLGAGAASRAGTAGSADAGTGGSGPPPVCAPGDHTLRFMVDGEPHSALLHIPGAGGPARLPLLLAFHGARYGARFVAAYYGLTQVAERRHFAVLYPQASHDVFWQLLANQTEDVEGTRLLLDQVEGQACIDSTRVYATGASNGGGFTARLGCEMADRLAAIAPVAGGYAPLGPCHPARPLPVLEVHGTRDQVVPYWGKPPDGEGSVAHFLGEWTELDGCTGPASRTVVARGVVRLAWDSCQAGSVVEHLRLAGTTHGWPGGDTGAAGLDHHPIPSRDPTGVKAAEVVWDFVSRFQLPAPAPAQPQP